MRVVVLGAGVIGITTAYFLAKDGHEVTVIDRAAGAARETSFANGGQISVSHTDPWASPANLRKVVGWLGKANAPLAFRLGLDTSLWRWIVWYLKNCTTAHAQANTERMLRVAAYSQSMLASLRDEIDAPYDARHTGILHVYRDPKNYERALTQAAFVSGLGCRREAISNARALDIEPALADAMPGLAGVIYAPDDESGDAQLFTENLATAGAGIGVTFRFETTVHHLLADAGHVSGVATSQGDIAADAVVAAFGSYTPLLLRQVGLKLPVYPAKGYSVTLPVGAAHTAPLTALIDDERKLVYSRLGARLRVAGLAETIGYDTKIDMARALLVLDGARTLFPNAGDIGQAEYWTGLRPQTPDSVPVLGATPLKGLYLNTGHGTLGWTMAAGSARAVADVVGGRAPAISLTDLGISRFL